MHVVCSLCYSARHLVWHQELGKYLQVARSCYSDPILHKAPGSGGHLQGATNQFITNQFITPPSNGNQVLQIEQSCTEAKFKTEKCQNPACQLNEMLARRGGAGLSPAPSRPRMMLSVTSFTPSGVRRSLWPWLCCLVHGTRSKPSRPVGQVGLAPRALGCSEGS